MCNLRFYNHCVNRIDCAILKIYVKQNPVIPKFSNGATTTEMIFTCEQLYLYSCICRNVEKIIMYKNCITGLTWAENRSDMDCE